MWLCNAFWNAPATGTDSKAGTIVHESSHWTAAGGTGDYAYGQSAAKSLATSNPNNAVMNADSHEYFAENTPFQS
jgi:peptidyl-Lys metalloendopeptidase